MYSNQLGSLVTLWLLLITFFPILSHVISANIDGIRKIAPQKITPQKIAPQKISPYENYPLWKLLPRIFPPKKLSPGKITPNEIPSPLINHANERKNKITKFFALTKAVQYNILIKTTNVLFDTQMISQKILGLDTFFTEWIKSKSRRTETRQSNYKIW